MSVEPRKPTPVPLSPPPIPIDKEEEDRRRWLIIILAALGGILIAILLAILFRIATGPGGDGINDHGAGNGHEMGPGGGGGGANKPGPPSGMGTSPTETNGVGNDKPNSSSASTPGSDLGTPDPSEEEEAGELAFTVYERSTPVVQVPTSTSKGNGGLAAGSGSQTMGGSNPFDVPGMRAKTIVLVVDISLSMQGEKWLATKECIKQAIESLKPSQKIKMIGFSDLAWPDNISSSGKLYLASPSNKKKMIQWLESVSLQSGTNPIYAMDIALKIKPEVIFLLTDGEFQDPPACVDFITRENHKSKKITKINCIELNVNNQALAEIAKQNDGTLAKRIVVN